MFCKSKNLTAFFNGFNRPLTVFSTFTKESSLFRELVPFRPRTPPPKKKGKSNKNTERILCMTRNEISKCDR